MIRDRARESAKKGKSRRGKSRTSKSSSQASVFLIGQISQFRVVEQTSATLIFRFDYSELTAILYGFIGLFLVPFCFIGAWFVIQSSSYQWFSPFIGVLCCIPLVILIWLMQTIGFYETWRFDRTHKTLTIRRKLAIGYKSQQLSQRAIKAVHVSVYSRKSKYYGICLEPAASVSLDLTKGGLGDRVLYTTSDPLNAEAFANQLRYYLDLLSE